MTNRPLDSVEVPDFRVSFHDCNAGWINMDISHGSEKLAIWLSYVYEPLPALLKWLESISAGDGECSFEVDEEGSTVMFRATSLGSDGVQLHIERLYGKASLDCYLPARELVATFYRAFVDFSLSPEYKPQEWEIYLLADAVREESELTIEEWTDSVLHLSRRELQKAIWRLHRLTFGNSDVSPRSQNYATDEEVLELTGKPPVHDTGLYFWPCDEWVTLVGD